MLPNAARVLRERISGGNLGLRDPRSIIEARNTLFNLFSGKVPLRQAELKPSEKPYLIGRVGVNRGVLLEAAASCVKSGSGSALVALFATAASVKFPRVISSARCQEQAETLSIDESQRHEFIEKAIM